MPSDQNFPKRLREAAQKALAPQIENLAEEIAKDLQSRVSESLNQLKSRFEGIEDFEFSEAQTLLAEAVSAASAESAHHKEEMLGFLAHFAHDVRSKETQEEILNLLLDGAHRFAPRVALFVTRGDQFQGWSSRGYPEEASQRIVDWSCAQDETPLLRDALAADGLTSVNQVTGETKLVEALGEDSPSPWHAFPMRAIRRPVAVLLAAPSEDNSCDLESLCVLMDLTGLCIENIALKIMQEMRSAVSPVAEPLEQSPAEHASSIAAVGTETFVEEEETPLNEALQETQAVEETEEQPEIEEDTGEEAVEAAQEPEEVEEEIAEETMKAAQEPEVTEEEIAEETMKAAQEPEVTEEEIAEEAMEAAQEPEVTEKEIAEEVMEAAQEAEEEIAEEAIEEAEVPAEAEGSVDPEAAAREALQERPGVETDEETTEGQAAEEEAADEVLAHPEEDEIRKEEALPETEVEPVETTSEEVSESTEPGGTDEVTEAEIEESSSDPEPPSEAELERVDAPLDMVQQIETSQEEPPLGAQQEIQEIVASEEETPKGAILREVEPPSEEEKLHTEAKRFARLLVSEIKLYNEQGVVKGKANADLYLRLKRDVDRSRDMYEKRISPIVSHKADYFHDEIIRILADSDPSKLGSEYPGSRVESQA